MKLSANFNPGPSQLYFTVADHLRSAVKERVLSLSHRSKGFETIFRLATDGLKELLALPDGFHIFFTASATETWERTIQNLVEKKSLHLVNGAFSKRYYEVAGQLGKMPSSITAAPGHPFEDHIRVNEDIELICLTHNETSTGVSLPLNFIHRLRQENPNALIAVDAVSSLPYPVFDYADFDSLFFSVQKGFGMPAGQGVWIVNDRCLAKAQSLMSKNISIGSYHTLPALHQHAIKYQTPETPNVLAIYLLGKVVQDFLRRGIHIIRKETEYKAALLYQALEGHPLVNPFVSNKAWRSNTVIVADCGIHTERINKHLTGHGFEPGDGYGEMKTSQLRFANFPAHSKEQFECLVDELEKLK